MAARRALVIGGLVAALAVPAGVAVAAVDPSPGPRTPSPTAPGYGYGPGGGAGRMGGIGNPEDCPFYDSPEAQQWRSQREQRQQLSPAERQKLVQQHREQMQKLMSGTATSS
jgi:hypothetical protein